MCINGHTAGEKKFTDLPTLFFSSPLHQYNNFFFGLSQLSSDAVMIVMLTGLSLAENSHVVLKCWNASLYVYIQVQYSCCKFAARRFVSFASKLFTCTCICFVSSHK